MILNRQRTVRVARAALESFLRRMREQLDLGAAEVTICLVNDAEIARMNEAFRNKKGPTDVLSFPAVKRRKRFTMPAPPARRGRALVAAGDRRERFFTPLPIAGKLMVGNGRFLGDIAISPATARRNAKKYGRTLLVELQILMLHGVLHLLGFDHETDDGEMNRVEQQLRRRFGLA
jgi:probable rRNA maturation factor